MCVGFLSLALNEENSSSHQSMCRSQFCFFGLICHFKSADLHNKIHLYADSVSYYVADFVQRAIEKLQLSFNLGQDALINLK